MNRNSNEYLLLNSNLFAEYNPTEKKAVTACFAL